MYGVLLVDDEPSVLDMEKRAIEKRTENFHVVGEAYSVREAIGVFKKVKPDVILTDMKMPKESGIELIKYISELEDMRVICVAVSGYSDFDYVRDAFMYGAFDYLLKPLEPKKVSELFARINRLLISTEQELCKPKLPKAKISSVQLVEEIEEYIKSNLSGDNSILSICTKFMINQPYLSKIFKKHKNYTYNEYLMLLKVEEAKRLLSLKEEYLIGEISGILGFSDQFYFSKFFKTMVGCSPRDYRHSITK